MTVGPYGGAFTATVFDPSAASALAAPGAPSFTAPQVQVIDASPVTQGALTYLVATLPALGTTSSGRLIERVVITGPSGSYAYVHAGDAFDRRSVRDISLSGELDVADYNPALYVPPATPLVVVWNATSGVAFASLQWRDLT